MYPPKIRVYISKIRAYTPKIRVAPSKIRMYTPKSGCNHQN